MTNSPSSIFRTDHVRIEHAFCSMPGLFGSWPKPKPKNACTDVTYETTDATFTVFGRLLGVMSLRVLQALLALAALGNGQGKKIYLVGSKGPVGLELERNLIADDLEFSGMPLVVQTSYYEIAHEIGYSHKSFDGGAQVKAIQKALEELCSITVTVYHKDGGVDGSHLMSHYRGNSKGRLVVAISPQLAAGITGQRRYSRLDMNEIRALRSDPTRLIHQRLCGFIDPGKSWKVSMDTLDGYAWPMKALNIKAIQKRKRTVRETLAELAGLGWTVAEYAAEKFAVTRRGPPN